jgi:hypothetical protein
MPYRITGQERRVKKSELSLLKRDIRQFWYFFQLNEDMYKCYGHASPMSPGEGEKILNQMAERAKVLEKELGEEVAG